MPPLRLVQAIQPRSGTASFKKLRKSFKPVLGNFLTMANIMAQVARVDY